MANYYNVAEGKSYSRSFPLKTKARQYARILAKKLGKDISITDYDLDYQGRAKKTGFLIIPGTKKNPSLRGRKRNPSSYSLAGKIIAKVESAYSKGGYALAKSVLDTQLGSYRAERDLSIAHRNDVIRDFNAMVKSKKNPNVTISGGSVDGWQAAHAYRQLPDGRVQILTNPKGTVPKSIAHRNPLSEYELIVGNIGTVYSGSSKKEALKHYSIYVKQSKTGRGRAGGEDVTLMQNGEPIKEFFGSNSDSDY